MLSIKFPDYHFGLRNKEEKEQIWDAIRKKWVRLTPEEWVRQNLIQYLIQTKNYPSSLFSVEKEIQLGELKKRYDVIVYKNAQPWMIVECKQPDVPLTGETVMQIIRYNLIVPCSYIVISNGNHSKGWYLQNGTAKEIQELPAWE